MCGELITQRDASLDQKIGLEQRADYIIAWMDGFGQD